MWAVKTTLNNNKKAKVGKILNFKMSLEENNLELCQIVFFPYQIIGLGLRLSFHNAAVNGLLEKPDGTRTDTENMSPRSSGALNPGAPSCEAAAPPTSPKFQTFSSEFDLKVN